MLLSGYLLGIAARTIQLSIAYTVWVGIGAIGAFLGGLFLFGEKVNFFQIVCLVLVVLGIIGLKVSYLQS